MDILKTTQTGRDAEYESKWNGASFPKPTTIHVGDGSPITDNVARLALTTLVNKTAEFSIYGASERVLDADTGIETVTFAFVLPEDWSGTIKEIGLVHNDGKLHRYAPYHEATGGLTKGPGYTQTLYVSTLVTDDEPAIGTISFAPLDAQAMATIVVNKALLEIPRANAETTGLLTAADFQTFAGYAQQIANIINQMSTDDERETALAIITQALQTGDADLANAINNIPVYQHPPSHSAEMIDETADRKWLTSEQQGDLANIRESAGKVLAFQSKQTVVGNSTTEIVFDVHEGLNWFEFDHVYPSEATGFYMGFLDADGDLMTDRAWVEAGTVAASHPIELTSYYWDGGRPYRSRWVYPTDIVGIIGTIGFLSLSDEGLLQLRHYSTNPARYGPNAEHEFGAWGVNTGTRPAQVIFSWGGTNVTFAEGSSITHVSKGGEQS